MKEIYDIVTYNGREIKISWFPGDSYQNFKPITQAYGFCFRENKLLMIQSVDLKHWQVPGGKLEPGETPEDALIREVGEEANILISDIVYLGAQKVETPDQETVFQLRFAAKIIKLLPRKIDPAEGIIARRRFVNPDDFSKIANWGRTGEAIVWEAKRKLNIK
jgi:8-oxo-dGTP pyrophosphatase MutT (NUDIX family)